MKTILNKFNKPVVQSSWMATILLAIPRFICGALLAFSFGSDKFGMPWSPSDSEFGLFEVAAWFPEDVATFGGIFALAPVLFAWLGAASEAVGGLFLMLGYKTRTASLFIACTMLVAIFFQKWDQGVWGMLPALGFLWVALQGLVLSSGKLGLDAVKIKRNSFKWKASKTKAPAQTITFLIILLSATVTGQIKGDGNLKTDRFSVESITTFELNMYADVTLDASLPSEIVVTAESNLIDQIDFEVVDGKLNLKQKEWIQPSEPIKIIVGVPNIEQVTLGSHETLTIRNLDQKTIALTALIGEIRAYGTVEVANINAENGFVNAKEMLVQTSRLNVWGRGKASINASDEVLGEMSKDAKISFVQTPKKVANAIKNRMEKKESATYADADYITLKIKNNSWNRNHFEVRGPKKDGGHFGYGFPMMPGATKKERWTVGTKVYKKSKLGLRKLLVTITADDAGKTIQLFE